MPHENGRAVRAALAASIAVLCGCASYEARPLVPSEELAALGRRGLSGFTVERWRPGEREPSAAGPFDPSDGLDGTEVVAVALTLNPALRAARARRGESEAALIQAGLWPNPEVGFALRFPLSGPSGVEVDTDLLWQLLKPRERAARRKAARLGVEEFDAETLAAEWRVAKEARLRRLEVLGRREILRFIERDAAVRGRARDLLRDRREKGDARELDHLAAELELAEVRRQERTVRTELESARRALIEALGLPPGFPLKLQDEEKPIVFDLHRSLPDAEIDRRLLAGRPELRAAEIAYRHAEEELRAAVRGQLPFPRLGAAAEREEGHWSAGFAVSQVIPLFDRNQAEIARKESSREAARREFVALLHKLRAEAYSAREALRSSREEVEAFERETMPLLVRSRQILERALEEREASLIEFLAARRREIAAEREFIEALTRHERAAIELESATGGPIDPPTIENRPSERSRP